MNINILINDKFCHIAQDNYACESVLLANLSTSIIWNLPSLVEKSSKIKLEENRMKKKR